MSYPVLDMGREDISPKTALGQGLSSIIMILGYAIIAVPTGIVTVEMSHLARGGSARSCGQCAHEGHDEDARFCKYCGFELSGDIRLDGGVFFSAPENSC